MGKKYKFTTAKRKELRRKDDEALQNLELKIIEYDVKSSNATMFSDIPISENTLRGLKEAAFVKMTEIQKQSIPVALKGYDILGAAKTGSGKTLAFLIPVIEKLHREKWTEFDGLAALIISPTRELAMQTFEVLTKIGKYSSFSAGLVIGGKDAKFEMERISKINILIGTPGRILHHMDQSISLNTFNLKMLVLDEADRCLDMGFKKTLDAIVSNLPSTKQTLLFSATQSQSLSDLARLSLTNYKSIGTTHLLQASDGPATPKTLEQSYVRVALPDKLDVLFSFIKSHLKSKMVVFLSSSKQVYFVYEVFRKMQPGISLMHLHGRQKQTARTETMDKFSRIQHACLFATDVVARGIDFPSVDWVIQVDCPEDVDTYIHRAGRSARYGKNGKSLIILTPEEESGFLKRLNNRLIEPKKLTIKHSKKRSVRPQLQLLLFKDPELKYLAQKAFISYVRSIYIKKDSEVFKFDELPLEEFALSLGLPGAPKINIKGMKSINEAKELKNRSRKLISLYKANEDGEIEEDKKTIRTKYDRMFGRKNQTVLSEHYLNIKKTENQENSSGDEFMVIKQADCQINEDDLPELILPTSKRAQKRALSKKASLSIKSNPSKLKFDDDGIPHPIYELEDEDDFHKKGAPEEQKQQFLSKETQNMAKVDIKDKQIAKEKKQEKKRKRMEAMRREMEALEYNFSDKDERQHKIVTCLGTDDLEDDIKSNCDYSSEYEKESRPFKKRARNLNLSKPEDYSQENHSNKVIEVEKPETLEDLESLTAKLMEG